MYREGLHAVIAHPDAVKEEVVDIVDLQIPERVVIHPHRRLAAPCRRGEVGQLRGHEVLVARMALERYARGLLRMALAVSGRRVEIVDTILYGLVDKAVDSLLVERVTLGGEGRPAHAAVAENRHLITRGRVGSVGHLPLLQVGERREALAAHGIAL